MRLFHNSNLAFVQHRKVFYIISVILLLVSLAGVIVKGLNWSTDFKGGVSTIVNLKAKDPSVEPLHIDQLRKVINDAGFKDTEIQFIGSREDCTFQIKMGGEDDQAIKEQLLKVLNKDLADYTKNRDMDDEVIQEFNTVGARAGMEMRNKAVMAVGIALVLMVIYVGIRFEFTFGLMAILALFHDVFIIVGVFAWSGKEITMTIIAALLAIVGYSINDTIVIFDRIREDLKIYRKDDIPTIFNRSINATLSRTVITAGTTLLTSLALYFFGGPVIHDFALAMSLGILFGTYSSIFVASNLVLDAIKGTKRERRAVKQMTKKS
ncbi:MAG: protein translocase subunit SecF [Candidatus Cloacimonadaceae bacterium]|jgi:preprotein translocase subunit SecF|nr:protein translocase subunit SecF [Candidatus Cloacimonadota bacterium]MDX9949818.1 protein translocase subunit SecF [Candidatus Syntrophosphaera sp.]